jgi:hypothetical protein
MNFRCPAGKVRVGDIIRYVGVVSRINDKSLWYVDRRGASHGVPRSRFNDGNIWWISRPSVIPDLVRVVYS